MRRAPVALWLLLAAGAAGGAGCNDAEAQGRIELGPEDLPPSAGLDATGEAWQSVAWSGEPWQAYPGETTVVFAHGLGRVPTSVLTWVSFDAAGRQPGLATGDMAVIVEVDEARVSVRNTTEADFFCRIVLQ